MATIGSRIQFSIAFLFAGFGTVLGQDIINMSNGTSESSCDAIFRDPGGTGDYGPDLYYLMVIEPSTPGYHVKLSFSSLDLENGYDWLDVFDGFSVAAPQAASLTGSTIPSDIIGTGPYGELTFRFISDGTIQAAGWEATITCVSDEYIQQYDATVSTCDAIFVDSGGSGMYANDTDNTLTIAPETAGNQLEVSFSSFQLEPGFDFLYVHDGTTTAAPLIGAYTGNTLPPDVRSTSDGGELTFNFVTDGSGLGQGWEASVTCVPAEHFVIMDDGSESTCDATFLDPGRFGDYDVDADYVLTLSPEFAGNKMHVSFSAFDIESGFDFLDVYDGPTTGSSLLISLSGSSLPSDLVATGSGGELTFHFTSDGTINASGWEAIVGCDGPKPPDQPNAATFGTVTETSIVVNWAAPADNGDAITSYSLEQKEGAAGTYGEIFSGNALTYTPTGLSPNTEYFYRVSATNGIGTSPESDDASTTTLSAAVPDAPASPTFGTVDARSIVVNWTAPNNHGSAITSYSLEQKEGSGGTFSEVFSGNMLTFTSTGLTPNTQYFYRVTATNGIGNSSASAQSNTTTLTAEPEKPDAPTFGTIAASTIDVNWTLPNDNGSTITNVILEQKEGSGGTYQEIFSGLAVTYQTTSLSPGTQYFFRVKAQNGVGDSPYSNEANATTLALEPDAPALILGTVTSTTIQVSWTTPASNGSAITGYSLERKQGTGGTYAEVFSGAALTFTSTSLTSNTTYYFRVKATNGIGDSPFSTELNTTTLAAAPGAPDEPAAPTFGTVTSSSIVVNWTAPNDNGSTITGYTMEQKQGSGTYAQVFSGNALTYTSTGLSAGTSYTFRVKATNSAGDSPFSSEASTATSAAVPDQPSAPTFGTVDASSIVVNWTAPNSNGAAITGYQLQQKEGSGGAYSTVFTGTALTYTASGLNANTEYFFKVLAANSVGNSPYSNQASATTLGVKLDQTITIAPISDKTFGSDEFVITATASSGLPVVLSSSGPIQLSGTSFSLTGAGTATIFADQEGDDDYNPAPQASVSFEINKADQTISFEMSNTVFSSGLVINLSATASSGLAVAFAVTDGSASVTGDDLSVSEPGSITVQASQGGDNNYNAATQVEQTICVFPQQPNITIENDGTPLPTLHSDVGFNVQWFKDGDPVPGEFTPTLNVTEPGAYTVQSTADGCVSEMSDDFVIVFTGLEIFASGNAVLYPNPADDQVRVSGIAGRVFEVGVGDVTGRNHTLVFEQADDVVEADVRFLSDGMYLLRIVTSEQVYQIRLIKR